jgi:uncharacterized protein involved in response to NO
MQATPTLFSYGFRPFFLLASVYAAISIWSWVLQASGQGTALALSASWHSHEMLYGLVPAAIAGFLLTAISNWTGTPPLARGGLAGLTALWLAGRAAMWSGGLLPDVLVAAIDGAFLPVLAIYVARVRGASPSPCSSSPTGHSC